MKLNLGSGAYPLDGWTNYDLISHPGVTQHDLTKGIPLPDNSVEFIFSEHMIEHIERLQADALLRECKRVLKPQGVMRICMPDLRKIAQIYIDRNESAMVALGLYESNQGCFCNFINQAMRAWGHKYLWDEETFTQLLQNIGFSITRYSDFPFKGYRNLPTDFTVEVIK